jgi:hypothetical protein
VIADIGYFNITINKGNIEKLDATGVNIKELKNNAWNIGWGPNFWNVRYACRDNEKPKLIIKASNGTVTEGTWECKARELCCSVSSDCHHDEWNKAHIYEKRGYLMHKIVLTKTVGRRCSFSCSIGCRKTTSKF